MSLPDPGPRYSILGTLGQGAFGAVFRAFDRELNREIALKCMIAQADEHDPGVQVARFLSEAAVLQGLCHPGVCSVLDAFIRGGEAWLGLELVPGESLEEFVIRAGPQDEAAAAGIMERSLEPLLYLPSRTPPVVHPDIKPANLRLTPDGRIVLSPKRRHR